MIDANIDTELWAMRLMAPDELERFTVVLETIQHENAWLTKWDARSYRNPDLPLNAADRDEYLTHEGRWRRSIDDRIAMLSKYTNQAKAWSLLISFSLEAIEQLYEEGKLDQIKKSDEFWRLVYQRILRDRGNAIRNDRDWRNVKILEVLRGELTPLLPGFAEKHFREKRDNLF